MGRVSTRRALGLGPSRSERIGRGLRGLFTFRRMLAVSLVLTAGIGIGLVGGLIMARFNAHLLTAEELWEQREAQTAAMARSSREDPSRLALVPSPLPDEQIPEKTQGQAQPAPAQSGTALTAPLPARATMPSGAERRDPSLWVPTVALPPPVAPPPARAEPERRPDRQHRADRPAWQHFAVAPPAIGGRPMIAVVIDDMGVDRRRSDRIVALPGPLTTAWMTYAEQMDRQAEAARARGHELIIHFPMEPLNRDLDAGPDVLRVGYAEDRLRTLIAQGLGHNQGFVGINNHMGSRFTTNPEGMRVVMEELKSRGMLFLDSLTSTKSVGGLAARKAGVPFALRDIFIDNDADVASVLAQLHKVEQTARRNGSAIAIGHPHDGTLEALRQWLPGLQAKGFVLVPLTAIVKHRMDAKQG